MKRKICTNMRYLIRFHRNIYYERSNIRYLVSNRHILLIFKLNISVSIISKKKKDFTGGRVKTVIHRGRYVHFADSSCLNREQTSLGTADACHFSRFHSGDKGTRKRRYRSYLSFAYRLCSRHTDKQCPAIRSPF